MQITRTSMISGNTNTMELDVTQEQLTAWESGVNAPSGYAKSMQSR